MKLVLEYYGLQLFSVWQGRMFICFSDRLRFESMVLVVVARSKIRVHTGLNQGLNTPLQMDIRFYYSFLCVYLYHPWKSILYSVSLVKIDVMISPFRFDFVSIKSIPHRAVGVSLF